MVMWAEPGRVRACPARPVPTPPVDVSLLYKRANGDADCGSWPSDEGPAVTMPTSRAWRLTISRRYGDWPGSGGCVMPRLERPLGSRVRVIRTHGLNGGPTCNRPVLRTGLG